jgi:hypothetical protein
MEKFLVLYMAPVASMEEMMKNMTPEQAQASRDEWGSWMKERAGNFVDMGGPVGKTKRVTANGITDTKNEVAGYSIVQAASHEDAAKMFENMPQIPGGYTDVMRIASME